MPADSRPEACGTAVLQNGFTFPFLRRDINGAITRLWLCDGASASYIEIPSEQIESFVQAERAIIPAGAVPARDAGRIPAAVVPGKNPIDEAIGNAARRYEIDPDFLASIVKAESRFNPTAVSAKGARGLMQLMPQTAASLGIQDAFDPTANVEGGTKYLRQLLEQYHWDAIKALAAYNAGPQRVQQYGGLPPHPETRDYVSRIINDFNRKKLQQKANESAVQPSIP